MGSDSECPLAFHSLADSLLSLLSNTLPLRVKFRSLSELEKEALL